jgi:diguanylate cyclase (GGDEF)-like protein
VVGLVLAIGVLNLALGFVAAAALVDPPFGTLFRRRWTVPRFKFAWPRRVVRTQSLENRQVAAATTSPPDLPVAAEPKVVTPGAPEYSLTELHAQAPATIPGVDELPADWLKDLAAQGIVTQSFVEGAAHALRLEVCRYREQLIAADTRGRALTEAADASGLNHLAAELRRINADWLQKQATAAQMLSQRTGTFGDDESAAVSLEQVLLDQAAELKSLNTNLEAFNALAEADGGGKYLLDQVATLVDQAHALRDRMLDLLATMLRTTKSLEQISTAGQLDAATGLPNRTGLEAIFEAWWRDDPERSRPLSAVLIDIDRFGRLNQRQSIRAGDETIVALSRVFDEFIRKDRGYDRMALVGGESFLMILGDTGPHEALTTAERLRQTVEATTFDNQGTEFEVTLSCGVIEINRLDTVTAIIARAAETLKFAKKSGRNRCALDKGGGPSSLEPPQFPVKGRVIKLPNL